MFPLNRSKNKKYNSNNINEKCINLCMKIIKSIIKAIQSNQNGFSNFFFFSTLSASDIGAAVTISTSGELLKTFGFSLMLSGWNEFALNFVDH